ncbi:hypothetical protein SJAG_04247 [Schizosaccharomyces japonicus yFS275]|uniref:G-protein coupled receptors family 1 profile domain-containing protein n=1 Tax=Schizosaccharomyces japonicus (strain yFS275 / FY16936) TaxID=402676 RepID=B6K6B9_SCHJY|nr:hypothetical protein SJAG_04247 [Schizosaccharomyces japonicus yFS275]EEB09073.1 hypothetical protein SJAG_04247 [Schizosaccharomyces japonicus yFS275]
MRLPLIRLIACLCTFSRARADSSLDGIDLDPSTETLGGALRPPSFSCCLDSLEYSFCGVCTNNSDSNSVIVAYDENDIISETLPVVDGVGTEDESSQFLETCLACSQAENCTLIEVVNFERRDTRPSTGIIAGVGCLVSGLVLVFCTWLCLCVKRRHLTSPIHWSVLANLSADALLLAVVAFENTGGFSSSWQYMLVEAVHKVQQITCRLTFFFVAAGYGITRPIPRKLPLCVTIASFPLAAVVLVSMCDGVPHLSFIAQTVSDFLQYDTEVLTYVLVSIFVYKRFAEASAEKDKSKARVYRNVLAVVICSSFMPRVLLGIYYELPLSAPLSVEPLFSVLFDLILAYQFLPTGQNLMKLSM